MIEAKQQHRSLFLFSGDHSWCRDTVARAISEQSDGRIPWIGNSSPENFMHLPAPKVKQLLGQEFDTVVFDAHDGFDADAFGAISGTIRGGGQLLLLTPPLREWPDYEDPDYRRLATWPYDSSEIKGLFLKRFASILQTDSAVTVITPESAEESLQSIFSSTPASVSDQVSTFELTKDQQTALGEIMHVASGHRRRPLVITADRGRGKSSVLGIAAAELLRQGKERILVTAPSPNAVEPLFQHASRNLPEYRHGKNRLYHNDKSITFIAPDELIHNPVSADLLIVDEAAAIPAPLLQRLLENYSRIVFSTTVHGYEGTGRGFAIRFKSILDRLTPDWHSLKMNEPVRWADDDPLEKLVFSALLLDAEAADDESIASFVAAQLSFECFTREALIANEQLLREAFGLLVSAHYRTRPFDLRYLLDGPNVEVWCAMADKSVAAVVITVREGGFDQEMAANIRNGSRRPRGHLVPQQLAVHCALERDLEQKYLRIMRIAVHPVLRRKNIGSRLLAQIADNTRANELLCTSFGATPGLLDFWRKNGFEPVRVGLKREASSGAHSVIMLKKEEQEATLCAAARERFGLTLPLLLACELRQLEPEIVTKLRAGVSTNSDSSLPDTRRIERFAAGELPLDAALPELVRLAEKVVSSGTIETLDKTEADVLVATLLQREPAKEIADACGLNGQREVLDLLRKAVLKILGLG